MTKSPRKNVPDMAIESGPIFLWRNVESYPWIITKYPPYLFYWVIKWLEVSPSNRSVMEAIAKILDKIWAASWQNQQNDWVPSELRSAWAFAKSDQSSLCTNG